MASEYEELLAVMLNERRQKLETLRTAKGNSKKKIDGLMSEIGFIEVELVRYQNGLHLFRQKNLPKVGRWGKPETGQASEALP